MKTLRRIESLQLVRNIKSVEYKSGLCTEEDLEIAENRLSNFLNN